MDKNWSELDTMFPKVRKWLEKDIRIKLFNLGKKIGGLVVQSEIDFQKKYTDNACDAMNLAYYALKNRYCKIQRGRFGIIRIPEYEPKKINYIWYDYNDFPTLYTTSYTTPSGTYYASIWG